MLNSSNNSFNQRYLVKKIFNNNVILVETKQDKHELILVGRGLGFAQKAGACIDSSYENIEKSFIPANQDKKEEYQQLVNSVNSEILGLTTEIIAMVTEELNEELDNHIHIALADHISFTLKRIKDGAEITNPFLPETKTLYKKEYILAKKAVKMIEERFSINIPEGEVGFITLHIHGARTKRGVSRAMKYTAVIKEMTDVAQKELGLNLSNQSLNYARLVTHLRFALERIEKNEANQNPLLDKIKNDLKNSYKIADKLAAIIEKKLRVEVPEDEKGYLAMHLDRLRRNFNN